MAVKLNLNLKPSNNYSSDDIRQFEKQIVSIEDLLIYCSTTDCSDLYIKEYSQPYISRFGQIIRIPCVPTTRDEWMNFYDNYIKEELNAKYVRQKMLDTSTEIRIPEDNPHYGKHDSNFFRYRTSLGFSENNRIATFRMIRPEDPTFDTINYPEECKEALKKAYNQKTGIVFYTGPTGSGKGLHKDTVIPSIDGNKTVETLNIGDTIFDKNGEQTSVVDKYCPNDPELFRFHLSDGTRIDSTGGHLWEVETLNDWKPIKFKQYAVRYMDSDFLSFLDTINLGVIKLNDYINTIVDNSKFSKSSFINFIYKYFKDTLEKNNDYYIDITIILNNSTHINAKNRVKRINDFISKNKRTLVNNKEAKLILGSKFKEIIRNNGIEYVSSKDNYIDSTLVSKMIKDWYYDVMSKPAPKIKLMSSKQLYTLGAYNSNNRINFAIRRPKGTQYNNIDLPIDPYWLGAWLGDGMSNGSKICGMDLEILDTCADAYAVTKKLHEDPKTSKKYNVDFYCYEYDNKELLKENNLLTNKHIPNIYKIASIDDKLKLIAGLIDTDGSVGKDGTCGIGLINKEIIYSLREICCSLGFKCSSISKKRGAYKDKDGNIILCKMVYSFVFYPTVMLPLQVPRKKDNLHYKLNKINNNEISQQVRHNRFYIKNIEKIDGNKNDYYCLAVDSPTHMFLCTDSYVPTHNTTTLAAVMNTYTKPGEILDNKVFITLEDPIEYTFHSTDSVKFSQKELDKDFMSYASGIKQALREHPNCINIGEARDREVISAAIEAARTGHLVTTSFHAGDVGGTISRLLFHLDNNKDLSYDLILNLNIIMSQKLLKMEDHYQVDTQYLLFTNEVREYLLKVIDNDENIQVSINKLIKDQRFKDMKLVKDWDYAENI